MMTLSVFLAMPIKLFEFQFEHPIKMISRNIITAYL